MSVYTRRRKRAATHAKRQEVARFAFDSAISRCQLLDWSPRQFLEFCRLSSQFPAYHNGITDFFIQLLLKEDGFSDEDVVEKTQRIASHPRIIWIESEAQVLSTLRTTLQFFDKKDLLKFIEYIRLNPKDTHNIINLINWSQNNWGNIKSIRYKDLEQVMMEARIRSVMES